MTQGIARNKDFCNAFWASSSLSTPDAGVNILFARMRGAAKTTGDLRGFWRERALIEEEYANRLVDLSKQILGKDEIGELRSALDTLKHETAKLGASHQALATTIRGDIEEHTAVLLNKQVEFHRGVQGALERKFKLKQTGDGYVEKAKEKYYTDCRRIASYTQQLEQIASGGSPSTPGSPSPKDQERIQLKLTRAQTTLPANEADYRTFAAKAKEEAVKWESEWKEFADGCQDLEEERLDFMKDNLWAYANAVSTVCVTDDLSCEAIRTLLDQFEPDRDVENFVNEYGTGGVIPDPPTFIPYEKSLGGSSQSSTQSRPARFIRDTQRRPNQNPTNHVERSPSPEPAPVPPPPQQPHIPQAPAAPPPAPVPVPHPPPVTSNPDRRISGPLPPHPSGPAWGGLEPIPPVPPIPMQPAPAPHQPEPAPTEGTGEVLFYVKALYDYNATIPEEFDFQAGDVIAVTATPDDGWWSGELLDEARREPGRVIFPSNFVCLF